MGTNLRWGRICDEDRSAMRADPWWGRSCDQDRSVTRTDPKQISGWRIRWCQRLPCFFYTFWNNSKYINAWVESIKIIILLFYIQYSLSCLVFSQHVMHFNNNSFYKGCWCWLSLSQYQMAIIKMIDSIVIHHKPFQAPPARWPPPWTTSPPTSSTLYLSLEFGVFLKVTETHRKQWWRWWSLLYNHTFI